MAKFIELSFDGVKRLINIDTISVILPWGAGSAIYTTCEKMPIVNTNQSYDYVREQVINLSE